ncbi:MAG TPA: ABC transporter permease [Brevundimonas sp.]|jgi:putative ABC transport system permease protein|uniref:ABC transporter permease n=1 Tax=Brevundimonas sp. TaxID=1871086 RepID=UPI002E10B980|nr:ABC transporter permease [Brevundimonas sp.]
MTGQVNTLRLVLAGLARRPLTWLFHSLLLGLAGGLLLAVALVQTAAETRLQRDLGGVDLVVGAEGGGLQLVMSALLQADAPTGIIPAQVWTDLTRDPQVAAAVPVAMGDSVGDIRIVGTTPAYADLYGGDVAAGRWWTGGMEAVLGAQAAQRLGLAPGGTFIGAHGEGPGAVAHADHPYTVVGVLAPTGTVLDRLALTALDSVWDLHAAPGHDHDHSHDHAHAHDDAARRITAVLVDVRSPLAAVTLAPRLEAEPGLKVAQPAREVQRLNALLGGGAGLLRQFGAGLGLLAAAGFGLALTGALLARRREFALLKALGARPATLARLVLAEGLLLGLAGGLAGWAMGRAVMAVTAAAEATPLALVPPPLGPADLLTLLIPAALGLVAALPALVVVLRLDPLAALESRS